MIPIDAIVSMLFEGTSATIVFVAFYLSLIIYRRYPRLTKAGWSEIMLALFFFGLHLLLDMIDTLIYVVEEKRPISLFGYVREIRPIYTALDWCENFLAVVALILLIIGFLRLSDYIRKLWRGPL